MSIPLTDFPSAGSTSLGHGLLCLTAWTRSTPPSKAVNLLAQAVVNQLGRAVASVIATGLLGWIPIHYVLIRNRNGDRQRLTRLASDTAFSLCSGQNKLM